MTPPPVKVLAEENGIKVYQPTKMKDGTALEMLKEADPELCIVVAYGKILPKEILEYPKYGCINIHASLLPKLRGAAPIQWSIINGDSETGVTIMQTEAGIDTGDIICMEKTPISDNETAGELFDRLSILGANLLVKALDLIESGKATYTKQDDNLATHVKMLKKEDGIIDFSKSSREIFNFIRGMSPWPCAYTFLDNKPLKVHSSEIVEFKSAAEPGVVVAADSKQGLIVCAASGFIRLKEIQAEGGKRMADTAYLLGHKIEIGTKLNG
jgi:methionyl-tRNA formyltransferase